MLLRNTTLNFHFTHSCTTTESKFILLPLLCLLNAVCEVRLINVGTCARVILKSGSFPILKVDISKELKILASAACLKYRNYLEERKKLTEQSENKRKLDENISFLKQMKLCLMRYVEDDEDLIEKLKQMKQRKRKIDLFIKSNKLRKSIQDKISNR